MGSCSDASPVMDEGASAQGATSGAAKASDKWQDLREAFDMFDPDKTGRISVYSADTAFRLAGITFSDADNTHFLKSMGLEKQVTFFGLQNYADNYGFHKEPSSVQLQDDAQELREAYYVLSRENNGSFVSPYQLKMVMAGFGMELTDEDIDDMVREADFDHDGKVNYKDFAKIMTSL